MAPGQKIRVLIVDDVADTRENVRKLLQFEPDVEVVGVAKSGKEGIQLSLEYDPDVVLMDINMPDIDGISATEAIIRERAYVQVVILSVQGDPNYMRRAMLAGARDFLTKPPMADDLISAIRRAGEMSWQERSKAAQVNVMPTSAGSASLAGATPLTQGNVITVYSPKGGTGCTTIAVNLALSLHNDDTQVALIDGNLQFGDVAVFMNEQGKNTVLDLALRANELDPDVVNDVMIKHATSGLHILAAPSRPEQAEQISGDQFIRMIEYLRQLYAYVIIDTTPMLTDITLGSIENSDLIILIATQDIPSIKNARLFLDLLLSLGIGRDRVLFVMNKMDKRIAITPERVSSNLKQPVSATIPLDEKSVIPAVNRGVPFILDNRTLPAARGILTLAEEVRTALSAVEEVAG
jgi:pilus assembly protein CpaE